jgi:hypothetical protein
MLNTTLSQPLKNVNISFVDLFYPKLIFEIDEKVFLRSKMSFRLRRAIKPRAFKDMTRELYSLN